VSRGTNSRNASGIPGAGELDVAARTGPAASAGHGDGNPNGAIRPDVRGTRKPGIRQDATRARWSHGSPSHRLLALAGRGLTRFLERTDRADRNEGTDRMDRTDLSVAPEGDTADADGVNRR